MMHPAKNINQINLQIANGDYDEAIVSLTSILKNLKLVLAGAANINIELDDIEESNSRDQNDSSLGNYEYDYFSTSLSSSFLETAITNRGCQSSCCATNHTEVDQSSVLTNSDSSICRSLNTQKYQPLVFRDPIMVRGDFIQTSLDDHVCEQLSYVVLYNIALSHHLKSVVPSSSFSSSKRIQYMHKALSLYEHSHQVLMKQMTGGNNGNIPITHGMVLLGNIGHIHHALGNQRSAEMCLQCVLSRMMYLIVIGQADKMGNTFDIIMPLLSEGNPAPAA